MGGITRESIGSGGIPRSSKSTEAGESTGCPDEKADLMGKPGEKGSKSELVPNLGGGDD